jgi:hypothetical protein
VNSSGVDQVDRHGGANTNHTDRLFLREVVCADHSNETVNSQPPRLEITARDPARSSLRYHELRRRSPRAPRGQPETSIGSCASDAHHENTVERASGADHPLGVIFTVPTRVNRSVLSPHPLAVKSRPLDTGIADVDQKDIHD